jgi:hypothetical protein
VKEQQDSQRMNKNFIIDIAKGMVHTHTNCITCILVSVIAFRGTDTQ